MLFDTTIFIYADRGVVTAKELIMNTPERVISAVTYRENAKYFLPIDGLVLEIYSPIEKD